MEAKIQSEACLSESKKERCQVEKSAEPCLICSTPTQKLHLQVNACYACAAFYRRSLDSHKTYKCQNNNEKCDLSVKQIGRPLCRLCRYNKCVEIGMKTPSKPPSIDETFNYTKEFTELITNFIEVFKPKVTLHPYEGTRESAVKRAHFINHHFFVTAKMLSKLSTFSSISSDDKISLFLHFWNIFRLFERIYQAIIYFNSTDENDFRLQCSFDAFYDINNIKTIYHVSIPNPTFYSLMLPVFQKGKLLTSNFKKLNPKFGEFVYICHLTLWSCHEIMKIDQKTQTLAETITNKISEDIHDYYANELRVASYSVRQAQIFKLINLAEVVIRGKKQMIAGRKLFNFGQYYFPYCNFETNLFDYIDKNEL